MLGCEPFENASIGRIAALSGRPMPHASCSDCMTEWVRLQYANPASNAAEFETDYSSEHIPALVWALYCGQSPVSPLHGIRSLNVTPGYLEPC
jgi:hypothetical protein